MKIMPFKAYRYNPDVVGNVGDCISPPYDVIDPDQQSRLYERSEYNIARIIKGKCHDQDDEQSNVYTRAADYLSDWIARGALKADTEDAIYAYVQNFEIGSIPYQRLSFVALAELEDFGRSVKPHEQILMKPMQDRLKLKRTTQARFGLVFMLYDDPQQIAETVIRKAMEQGPAHINFTDDQGVSHQLYTLTDPADQAKITQLLEKKSCVIADGHHRYTTGLMLKEEDPTATHQMIAYANTSQAGLLVLATHRLVHNLDNFDSITLLEALATDFELVSFSSKEEMLAALHARSRDGKISCGLYFGQGTFYVATSISAATMDALAPEMSSAWRQLDVAVLHKLILENHLSIGEEQLSSGNFISYIKDTPNAIDDMISGVDCGEHQGAFFQNPVTIEQLFAVTETGERMPQKSTYFYPKMFTGLVVQKLEKQKCSV